MPGITSSSSTCHNLVLPASNSDPRLALDVRTGCAATLSSSTIVVHGGIVVPLDVVSPSIEDLIQAYTALNIPSPLHDSISGELFCLSLIDREWSRIVTTPARPRPSPRLFHELCAVNSCIILFGGLCFSDDTLSPCNDLWEFNLISKSWTLLHDGHGWQEDPSIPCPRFSHKLSQVSSLAFASAPDHFGIIIAGGRDDQSKAIPRNAVFDLVSRKYVPSMALSLDHRLVRKESLPSQPLCLDYCTYTIVNYTEDAMEAPLLTKRSTKSHSRDPAVSEMSYDQATKDSLIVYTPSPDDYNGETNPLVSFKLGKSIREGRPLPLYRKQALRRLTPHLPYEWTVDKVPIQRTIPHNLQLPTAGVFGQNIVVTGYLPSERNLAVFVFNIPTGKWLRLSLFCNHDVDTHILWGGFVWLSHHRVVLLGRRTFANPTNSSSVRFFSVMLTINLPVINLLANSELAGCSLRSHSRLRLSNAVGTMLDISFDKTSEELLSSDKSTNSSSENAFDDEENAVVFVSDSDEATVDSTLLPRLFSANRKASLASGEHNATRFSAYVHYVAPKSNFTKIRLVLPPAAITLGRNAFTRYGEQLSDLELISSNGDRIPVAMQVLMERWGSYFIRLLASAYVQAADKFESGKPLGGPGGHKLRTPSLDDHRTLTLSDHGVTLQSLPDKWRSPARRAADPSTMSTIHIRDRAPTFRLPFQETPLDSAHAAGTTEPIKAEDSWSKSQLIGRPHMNSSSTLIVGHAPDDMSSTGDDVMKLPWLGSAPLPPQSEMPTEPLPPVPLHTSVRHSSRHGSLDTESPRSGSVLEALSALRHLPAQRSPKHSVSHKGSIGSVDSIARNSAREESKAENNPQRDESPMFDAHGTLNTAAGTDPTTAASSHFFQAEPRVKNPPADAQHDGPSVLDFSNPKRARMESFLVPRKLYMPFNTTTIKCFSEFMYTGQIGSKWLLSPTTLENLMIAKFFNVPLLYDLILELLFGIIGRKAAYILKEGNRLKHRYYRMLDHTGTMPDPRVTFPLDEFEGFLDTVDDGYMDVILLGKCSNIGVHHLNAKDKRHPNRQEQGPDLRNPFSNSQSCDDGVGSSNSESADPRDSAHKSSHTVVPTTETSGGADNPIPNTESPFNAKEANNSLRLTSTDSSSTRSIESDDSFLDCEVQFLDARVHDREQDPRATSVFDNEHMLYPGWSHVDDGNADSNTKRCLRERTLQDLVSRDAPAPDDVIIDAIYEALTVVLDMKLIVRSMTVQRMSKSYAFSRAKIMEAIASGMKAFELNNGNAETDIAVGEEMKLSQHEFPPTTKSDRMPVFSRSWTHASETTTDTALTVKDESIDLKTSDHDCLLKDRLASLVSVPSQKSRLAKIRGSFLPLKSTKLNIKRLDRDIHKQIKHDKKQMEKSGMQSLSIAQSKTQLGATPATNDVAGADADVSSLVLEEGQTAQERNRRHHKFLSLFKFKDHTSEQSPSILTTRKSPMSAPLSSASSINSSTSRLSRIKHGFWHKHQ